MQVVEQEMDSLVPSQVQGELVVEVVEDLQEQSTQEEELVVLFRHLLVQLNQEVQALLF
jgi:hypothetical protein